ncbi:1-hydroxy-2-methyl-2-butenyl 4-diphosphate reductase [Streptomyces sp. F63]|uniref:5'-methylthioadenosine/S-adenosylhomocysteine nucleosidase family protein n=1 Tax=Streptomyces sp. F63 TaxID=2824887 RepID=UPI001B36B7F6|nr:1-hydroxy-2-methyl-2-butenyl 4-diphosphate reductase [Streptomyces sp. F63]MBQ0985847.1 1-hydroxy-2-methyl-2-butenyl 4-diphosphate reductase [Streptomyces sp. F63]
MPADGGSRALLIACALGIERLALRGGDRNGAPGALTVLRTGMGPRSAERAVLRGLSRGGPHTAGTAVLATGFCAALAPGMRPGDLVVAAETRDGDGSVPCTGTAVLAAALARHTRARPGTAVRTGPLAGTDHLVRGAERTRLHASGAIAADMESAAVLRTALAAGPRPVAAVRVVVDTPERELARGGTVLGGISAFRVLRTVLPAFYEWHRSLPLPRR